MDNLAPAPVKSILRGKVLDNKSTVKTGEIRLNGVIGQDWFSDGISAKQFSKQLVALGSIDALDLYITSEGGSVVDAKAMYAELIRHRARVNVYIDGLAASAATFLAMAGDTITIGEGDLFMIHNARTVARGDARALKAVTDQLLLVDEIIRDIYVARTGIKEPQIRAWMDAETWFSGKEAHKNGFTTALVPNKGPATNCVHDVPWITNAPIENRPRRAAVLNIFNGL